MEFVNGDHYCLISENVFINTRVMLRGSTADQAGYVKNNLFMNQSDVLSESALATTSAAIENNTFLSDGKIILRLNRWDATMSAGNNYWYTSDTNVIDSLIYDRSDDLNLNNYISYLPILSQSHPGTPQIDLDGFSVTGGVMNVHGPDGTFRTYITIIIGTDFDGNLPVDIETIAVLGPSGALPYNKDDFTYYPEWGEFFAAIPGSPELGEYTLRVEGYSPLSFAETTDTQTTNETIPVPDKSGFSPADGAMVQSKTPTFSWGPVSYPSTTIYYRLEIVDQEGSRVFATSRNEGMLFYYEDVIV